MPKEDAIEIEGVVEEILPGAQFRVRIEGDRSVLVYTSGKMRKNRIRTAVGDRVTLRETEIEHSIVLEGAVITDLANRIEDSLIGRNVSIYRLPVRPSAYRFMLGDNSEVGIRW